MGVDGLMEVGALFDNAHSIKGALTQFWKFANIVVLTSMSNISH